MSYLLRVALFACLVPPASAATFNVTRFDDPTPNGCAPKDCSLREAVIAANATTAHDTILLGSGSHALTRTCLPDTAGCQDLDVTQPLTIKGKGSAVTTIQNAVPMPGSPSADLAHTRVIESSGVNLDLVDLTLRNGHLTLADSPSGVVGDHGGCLYVNGGTLDAAGVVVESCAALSNNGFSGYGGGIALVSALATLNDVTVASSSATFGGGIYGNSCLIDGENVTIYGNTAGAGGGVYLKAECSMILGSDSVISGNSANSGGGIGVFSSDGIALGGRTAESRHRLRIEENVALGNGGGILVQNNGLGGLVDGFDLRNLTVLGNRSDGYGGGIFLGILAGGITSPVTIRDIELAANSADADGGGLYYQSAHFAAGSEIARLSVWSNLAHGQGGGMSIRGPIPIRDVSSTANHAIGGGSALLVGAFFPAPEVSHFTSFRDDGEIVRVDEPTAFSASIFDGVCTGVLNDLGANFVRSGSTGCPGTAASARHLGLSFGQFGGGHPVVGIVTATSVLRDQVLLAPNATDVRGYLRVGMGDSGAFEYDGVPK